jgi:hypothetical protein
MFFFFKQLQKDQNGNGSFGCQDRPALRSSANPSQYVGTVKDCKVPKQKNAILYHNHWPQKNSAEVMKDRKIHQFDLAHLVGSPSPPSTQ